MSVSGLFEAMNKQERLSWLGVAVLAPAAFYLAWTLFFDPAGQAGEASRAPQRLGWLAFVVFALGAFWIARRSGKLADERDRLIASRAIAASFGWLGLSVLALTWMFDSDALAAFMRSRSLAWMEVLLLFCLISSQAVGWGVRAVHYWRDRR